MNDSPSPNFAFLGHHDPGLVALATGAERLFAVDAPACIARVRLFGERLAQRSAAKLGLYTDTREAQLDLVNRLADARAIGALQKNLFHELRKAGNAATHENEGTAAEALAQLRIAHQLAIWFQRAFGNDRRFDPGPYVPPAEPRDAGAAIHAELERLRAEAERRRSELEAARAYVEQARAEAEALAKARLGAEEQAARAAEEAKLWELHAGEESERAKRSEAEKAKEREALEAERARLEAELAAIQREAKAAPAATLEARVEAAAEASEAIDIDEATTRTMIDRQLREAGWEVDSARLRYDRGARPEKGKSRAIAEWPTMVEGRSGFADYVLFAGLRVVGVIEAKRKHRDVSAVLAQAKRYACGYQVLGDETLEPGAPWGDVKVPFLFATNGRPYLRQLETKSGVWFRDARRATNHARALDGWFTPQGLVDLLKQDHVAAMATLAADPMPYIDRDYQRNAILAVERALAEGRERILVAMATGTGKTRTCIGLCYRLLKSKRAKRVLFLVDRTALGQQTLDALRDLRLEHLQTFAEIYDVKGLEAVSPDPDTRFHVATVQAMVRRILFSEEPPPIDRYDCVVVDECHRGYVLDRDLSERDFAFRPESEEDYISKYRRVLDHFAAVAVGLTATPALHTQEIFGDPVFTYSYREAVVDGFLVDHEPPLRIVTQHAKDGLHLEAKSEQLVLDRAMQKVESVVLADDLDFDVDDFHRKVISPSFNEVVAKELARHIDPQGDEKTLVFCVNDEHADLVVLALKRAFAERYGDLEDDAVRKITGSVDRPLEAIRVFKNERWPNVVVTVDLLTTGIDVPRIANLVLLRRVRSRILYEQMIGRATRLCPEIGKERFRIFDAVDLYARLAPTSAMKPVVTTPGITFAALAEEIAEAETDDAFLPPREEFLGKFQRKKRLFAGPVSQTFEAAAGMDAAAFAAFVKRAPRAEVQAFFAAHPSLPDLLDRATMPYDRRVVLSREEDVLHDVSHGYGADGRGRPADYLDEFRRFLANEMNRIPALKVVVQRPRDLTRKDLRELRLALDARGFDETKLRTAWADARNEDVAATIIGYIRGLALGSPLVPYGERVDRAVKSLLGTRKFTEPQKKWLDRIAKQLKKEAVVDRDAFNTGAFAEGGGYARIDRVFDGELATVLGELAEAVWKDVG